MTGHIPVVKHVIEDAEHGFAHCVEVDGVKGAWASYIQISRNGNWYGTTDYYRDELPELFYAEPIEELPC